MRRKRRQSNRMQIIPHGMISDDAILSSASVKKNRRSTGLPGKFPNQMTGDDSLLVLLFARKRLARVFILR